MLTIEQIRERLKDRYIGKVAEAAGVHPNTLYRLVRGDTDNPDYQVVKKVSDYLESNS